MRPPAALYGLHCHLQRRHELHVRAATQVVGVNPMPVRMRSVQRPARKGGVALSAAGVEPGGAHGPYPAPAEAFGRAASPG